MKTLLNENDNTGCFNDGDVKEVIIQSYLWLSCIMTISCCENWGRWRSNDINSEFVKKEKVRPISNVLLWLSENKQEVSTMLHLQGVTVTAGDDTLVPELKMSLMMDGTFLYIKWITGALLTFPNSIIYRNYCEFITLNVTKCQPYVHLWAKMNISSIMSLFGSKAGKAHLISSPHTRSSFTTDCTHRRIK